MQNCPSCIDEYFQFGGSPFVFSLNKEVEGYTSRYQWDQAAMKRFVAKVQAFYDSLPPDEQEAFDELVRQG